MKFLPSLADARDFPSADILALPTNKIVDVNVSNLVECHCEQVSLVDHARTGLYLIAKVIEVNKVWLPNYHCPALVEPFLAAKREVAFYPVTESLTPDFDFLSTHIAPNEAVVAVRYFGFDCGVKALAEFCRQRQAILIEDLAHAAGASELYGDVGVTSLIKFYPVKLGGQVLVPKYSPLANKLACQSDKLPSYTSVMWKSFAKKVIAKFIPERPKQFRYFNQAQCSKTIDQESEQLISNINRQVLMQRRQKNYRFIVDGIKSSTLGAPLFDELPDDVCPYVVPFLLHDELSFNYIRKNGIQVYRWEEVADLGCELSMKFRHRLVQLPCHQDLTQLQLQTVVDVLMGQSHE